MLSDCKDCKGTGLVRDGARERVCLALDCILGKVDTDIVRIGPVVRCGCCLELTGLCDCVVVGRSVDPYELPSCPYSQAHPDGCTCEGLEGL